ncbi:BTB/POZ domain-containing protein [Aspergillus mulundensis]|uniref:BTB domain-containing protein n=1 Tax=Aspergillus mulundensis TaxID=1810919 RepID=A0A3D8QAT0_9EURO|nr:hypothetical protein DSM5745_11159 [Aspergillus mulundensis]RDW58953.1 hypothetical protein DSM5745_11159 [Aspergillus mulundensis]
MAAEVIEPDGDLTIVCHDTSFQVCSKAIALASPVFKAMFMSNFMEGLSVKNSDPSNPAVVKLPEDDPEAFRIFSNIAHHRLDRLPHQLEIDQLDGLAMLVDKYQCASLIRGVGRSWILGALRKRSRERPREELWLLLHFAYVVNSQTYFSAISRVLVESSPQPFLRWKYARDNMRTFPGELLAQLDLLHNQILVQMQLALMDPVLCLTRNSCSECRFKIDGYLYRLFTLEGGLIPSTPSFGKTSIASILQSLYSMEEDALDWYMKECERHPMPPTLKNRVPVLEDLKKRIGALNMCLKCIKDGYCEKHVVE